MSLPHPQRLGHASILVGLGLAFLARSSPAWASPAPPTGRVEVLVVLDADGRPAADAAIVLLGPPKDGPDDGSGRPSYHPGRSDAAGAVAFDALPPGKYRIWANRDRLSSRDKMFTGEAFELAADAAGPKRLTLRLKHRPALTVRVKDAATGRPLPGATISMPWAAIRQEIRADAEGVAVVSPLTSEEWDYEAWADGHARAGGSIDLADGRDGAVELALGPGGDVEGTVRDPEGRPVARVGLSLQDPGSFTQVAYTTTDAEGRYKLLHLPVDQSFRLNAGKVDYLDADRPVRLALGKQTVDLTIAPRPDGGSVAGRVTDAEGRPVAGAEVTNPSNDSSQVKTTRTDADGRYRLDNLHDGLYGKEVYVRAAGLAPARLKVEAGPREKPAEVDVRLEPGHRVEGRVVDERGRPLAGATVYLSNAAIRQFSFERRQTGDDGRFAFDSLPAEAQAPTRLRVVREGYSEVTDRVLPLDTPRPVDLPLTIGGVVGGRVVDQETGKPLPEFTVRVTFASQRRPDEPRNGLLTDWVRKGRTFRDPDGRFVFRDLVVGMSLRVMVQAPGHEETMIEPVVVARADAPESLDYPLAAVDPAGLVAYAGQLRTGAGATPADVDLRLIAYDTLDASQEHFLRSWPMVRDGQIRDIPGVVRYLKARTDAEGRFRFDAVPRDKRVALAWWGDGVGPEVRLGLERTPDDQKGKLALETPAPARLVFVVDRRAFPTAAQIECNLQGDAFDSSSRNVPAEGGAVEAANLAPGRYVVRLIPPYRPDPSRPNGLLNPEILATADVTVRPGETIRVEFQD